MMRKRMPNQSISSLPVWIDLNRLSHRSIKVSCHADESSFDKTPDVRYSCGRRVLGTHYHNPSPFRVGWYYGSNLTGSTLVRTTLGDAPSLWKPVIDRQRVATSIHTSDQGPRLYGVPTNPVNPKQRTAPMTPIGVPVSGLACVGSPKQSSLSSIICQPGSDVKPLPSTEDRSR